jgi:hypothetical protein
MQVIWNVTPCDLVGCYFNFGGRLYPCLQKSYDDYSQAVCIKTIIVGYVTPCSLLGCVYRHGRSAETEQRMWR